MKILFIIMIISLAFLYKPREIKPPSSGVVMLDFNGWNGIPATELSEEDKTFIDRRVEQYFYLWDVKITRSDSVFYSYPVDRRVRVVITDMPIYIPYSIFYREVAGKTSRLNSLMLGDTLPSLVSTHSFYTALHIGEVVAHEVGHQLGLAHQCKWEGTTKVEEYNEGDSVTAPIMGSSYGAIKPIWTIGINTFGLYQDDTAIISRTFKRIH